MSCRVLVSLRLPSLEQEFSYNINHQSSIINHQSWSSWHGPHLVTRSMQDGCLIIVQSSPQVLNTNPIRRCMKKDSCYHFDCQVESSHWGPEPMDDDNILCRCWPLSSKVLSADFQAAFHTSYIYFTLLYQKSEKGLLLQSGEMMSRLRLNNSSIHPASVSCFIFWLGHLRHDVNPYARNVQSISKMHACSV